jgi:hypothetical protein
VCPKFRLISMRLATPHFVIVITTVLQTCITLSMASDETKQTLLATVFTAQHQRRSRSPCLLTPSSPPSPYPVTTPNIRLHIARRHCIRNLLPHVTPNPNLSAVPNEAELGVFSANGGGACRLSAECQGGLTITT